MIKTSLRPERRRMLLGRRVASDQTMYRHIGPSKYMPHIGAKQRAKGAK